ncbi:MAG: zinc and cadmium transporter [Patescibacteria group bacterium]|nr:zinc and cadmium transporter [Patescibacteria group bacterium]
MTASLAGVFFVWFGLGPKLQKYLVYLATFSMGIFAVIAYSLVEETVHLGLNTTELIFYIVSSFAILELASHLIPNAHHHHEIDHDHQHNKIDARRMIFGDAIHNIGDGILLVPAFITSPIFGLSATLGIFLHEVVQEVSEFFVMKEAGFETKKALLINFITAGTILIGIILGLFLTQAEQLIPPLVALSAGGFIYVIIRDLAPHMWRNIRSQHNSLHHLAALVAGLAIMISLNFVLPHEHLESEQETNNSIES